MQGFPFHLDVALVVLALVGRCRALVGIHPSEDEMLCGFHHPPDCLLPPCPSNSFASVPVFLVGDIPQVSVPVEGEAPPPHCCPSVRGHRCMGFPPWDFMEGLRRAGSQAFLLGHHLLTAGLSSGSLGGQEPPVFLQNFRSQGYFRHGVLLSAASVSRALVQASSFAPSRK